MLSPEKMAMFRKMLEEELAGIKERNRQTLDEMEQEVLSERFHGDEADQALFMEQRSRLIRLRDRERKLMNKIISIIKRIDDGDYGYCDVCGIESPEERLKMRPVATLCVECKEEQEMKEERTRFVRRRDF